MPPNLNLLLDKARCRASLPVASERRRIRKRAGVSQEDIAVTLGVNRATVCRWELGELNPGPAHLADYCQVLDELERVSTSR